MICEEFSCFIGPALSSSERRYLQLVLFSPSSAARYNKRNLKWQCLTATQGYSLKKGFNYALTDKENDSVLIDADYKV